MRYSNSYGLKASLCGLAKIGGFTSQGSADPLANHAITLMTPGTWLEVNGSYITDAGLSPDPTVSNTSPLTTPQWESVRGSVYSPAVISKWCGGAYRTEDSSLYVNGGGHNDYYGNEWYRFDVIDLVWKHVNWPSTGTYDSDGVNDDGSAESAHTYASIAYSPDDDVFFRAGSASGPAAGGSKKWEWNPNTPNAGWTQLPEYGVTSPATGGNCHIADYDSARGYFWTLTQLGGLFTRPSNDNTASWTLRRDGSYDDGSILAINAKTGAYHPVEQKFVVIGAATNQSMIYDVSNLASVKILKSGTYQTGSLNYLTETPVWTGDTAILATTAPGLAYDSLNGDLVAWSGGADIYVLDVDALTVTKVTPAGGNTVTPTAAATNGTFNRWQPIGIWGGKSCFIVTNDASGSVFIYKRA